MTILESPEVTINRTPSEVFGFLVDCNNHRHIMPEQVTNWQSTTDTCSFTIKGTADLSLKIKDTQLWNHIYLEPVGKPPFEFILKWVIESEGESCRVKAILEADLNMFLKMVASQPLGNFLKYQAEKLKTILHG